MRIRNEARLVRYGIATLLLVVLSSAAFAQGDGIGGVLRRDVTIETDEDEVPHLLPAGGLVTFGWGNDWSKTRRENGKIWSYFVITEEDGGLDRGEAWIPEDDIEIFSWACGEPESQGHWSKHAILCSPFVQTGFLASQIQWTMKFVVQGRIAAKSLSLSLVEEFSPAYKGVATAGPAEGAQPSAPAGKPGSCTVDQILKMKSAGLGDAQIKAACGG